jgi:hypothetical protein
MNEQSSVFLFITSVNTSLSKDLLETTMKPENTLCMSALNTFFKRLTILNITLSMFSIIHLMSSIMPSLVPIV